MQYKLVCAYIAAQGGVVDDRRFRLCDIDGVVCIDRWLYPFPKPNMDDIEKITAEQVQAYERKERLERFQRWEHYDALVETIRALLAK